MTHEKVEQYKICLVRVKVSELIRQGQASIKCLIPHQDQNNSIWKSARLVFEKLFYPSNGITMSKNQCIYRI